MNLRVLSSSVGDVMFICCKLELLFVLSYMNVTHLSVSNAVVCLSSWLTCLFLTADCAMQNIPPTLARGECVQYVLLLYVSAVCMCKYVFNNGLV